MPRAAVQPSARRSPILAERLFDPLALAAYPIVAGALGYTFTTGATEALRLDARAVLSEVWAGEGLAAPAPQLKAVTDRYDAATTWIVAYTRRKPVGVLGLLDMRRASVSLDLERREPPADLDLDTTRELARLAVLPAHRGRANTVLLGLFREMGVYCRQQGIETLFGGSSRPLFAFYRRFNPSARLIDPPHKKAEPEELTRYYQNLRKFAAGDGILFLMDVRGSSAWPVFRQFLKRRFLRSAFK